MASDKMRCVFCKGKNDKIILFVGEKLKKCQEVLSVRVKYKLKYNDIKLPTQINETDGYHRQCYGSFTALMAKYRDLLSETEYVSNSSPPTSSNSEIACEVASSSSNSPEDVDQSLNNPSTSEHPHPTFNSEILREDAAPSLDSQTTLGDVASSSICDLSINENTANNEISDPNIEDIETGRRPKNVCFFL